jgi:hypothetical protein
MSAFVTELRHFLSESATEAERKKKVSAPKDFGAHAKVRSSEPSTICSALAINK